MFTCPSCNQECHKLIASPIVGQEFNDDRKLRCDLCYDASEYRPTYLHQRFVDNNGIEGCKNLTVSKANVIARRIKSKDDANVIIDKRTGRETQY